MSGREANAPGASGGPAGDGGFDPASTIFGHHPDPSTDFCIEIDALEGLIEDVRAGLRSQWPVWARISRLLRFDKTADFAALDEIANKARTVVAALEPRLINVLSGKSSPTPAGDVDRLAADMWHVFRLAQDNTIDWPTWGQLLAEGHQGAARAGQFRSFAKAALSGRDEVGQESALPSAASPDGAGSGSEPVARLREALERICAATPANTNSATASRMPSWCKAVAATALAEVADPPAVAVVTDEMVDAAWAKWDALADAGQIYRTQMHDVILAALRARQQSTGVRS